MREHVVIDAAGDHLFRNAVGKFFIVDGRKRIELFLQRAQALLQRAPVRFFGGLDERAQVVVDRHILLIGIAQLLQNIVAQLFDVHRKPFVHAFDGKRRVAAAEARQRVFAAALLLRFARLGEAAFFAFAHRLFDGDEACVLFFGAFARLRLLLRAAGKLFAALLFLCDLRKDGFPLFFQPSTSLVTEERLYPPNSSVTASPRWRRRPSISSIEASTERISARNLSVDLSRSTKETDVPLF